MNFQPSKVFLQHESSLNVFYNTILLTFVTIGVNTCTYSLQHAYKVRIFYIATMRYSFVLDDKYKFTANVRGKDHKITKIYHFVAYFYVHIKVLSRIQASTYWV